ncbi:hypothetical protein [Aquimarina pacifica]|uniref:hypothetical protein n=1 Tax=Aquimarina pacifica TaxID=1296415 RepID=UPI0004B727EF|nr:hypothetical protein [Aquimarina pacifica]
MKYWNRQFRIDFPEPKIRISKQETIFIPVEISYLWFTTFTTTEFFVVLVVLLWKQLL